MTGGEVHMVFKVVLLQGGIDRLCAELRIIERQLELPTLLGVVKEWWTVDSTTVQGRDPIFGKCPGTDFDVPLATQTLVLDGLAIDVDVRVSIAKNPLRLPLLGVQTLRGYGFFLTNLPPQIGPRQVVDLSRVRWEVESRIKPDTPMNLPDEIDAERPCPLRTLLQVSLIASTITALLASTYHVKTRPQKARERWIEAPLHTRPLAAGRVLQVQRPGFRPEGGHGRVALRQDCRIPQPYSREAQDEALVSINSLQPTALRRLNGIARRNRIRATRRMP
jgi:hypothetical protein